MVFINGNVLLTGTVHEKLYIIGKTTFTGVSSFVSIDSSMFTTPIPFSTCPKTTCLPSKCGVGTVVMKNWEPLVFGPALAMLSKPTLSCYEDKAKETFDKK